MDNLINVFMNYKINRLIKYGTYIYDDDSDFVSKCFKAYFRTYVDNYYYGVFNTIEENVYNQRNLKLEFKGIKEEMLADYAGYELQVGNLEYVENRKIISELLYIAIEITKIDQLNYKYKDDIDSVVEKFISGVALLNDLVGKRLNKLISLVKETYSNTNKLLNMKDNYFSIEKLSFIKENNIKYFKLREDIAVLDNYKKTMVSKLYKDEKLDYKKFECLVQKISLDLLKKIINHDRPEIIFIELCDSFVSRGRIQSKVFKLIDNPIFRHNVVLCVNYSTYLNQKKAFFEDFHFGCIQDFSHINDVYTKIDNIYKEGIFNYLIVRDCKDKDIDYFIKYENEGMRVLVFEEE